MLETKYPGFYLDVETYMRQPTYARLCSVRLSPHPQHRFHPPRPESERCSPGPQTPRVLGIETLGNLRNRLRIRQARGRARHCLRPTCSEGGSRSVCLVEPLSLVCLGRRRQVQQRPWQIERPRPPRRCPEPHCELEHMPGMRNNPAMGTCWEWRSQRGEASRRVASSDTLGISKLGLK